MIEPDIVAAFRPVVDALELLGIGYYVGGSVASSLYGVPRSTADADLVAAIQAAHADPFAAALEADYYVDAEMIRDAIVRKSMFNVVHLATGIKVDVYVLKGDAWNLEAFGRRRADTFAEGPGSRAFSFGSAEDILLHKLVWFRMGGETSDRQWTDVLGVIRVQQQALDAGYLDRWSASLGVADLLARARAEAQ